MCGILGSVNVNFDKSTLDLISHRGPDSSGIQSYQINNNKIIFGHRRLSIIDLSETGYQPMVSNCSKYSIIFNGEIYNHKELREKLPNEIIFRGSSDTETILNYVGHFGIKSIVDLNGIFSFALLDKEKNKLFFARDPFGVKPLYYFNDNGKIIFSSEIRPIKRILKKTSTNERALASLLRLRYNPSPHTLHKEIKKVIPGHYHVIDLNKETLKLESRFFSNKYPKKFNYKNTNLIKRYGHEFENAVKRQLLSDVEVGVLLSGGIDSAMVAEIAQRNTKYKLKAFTVGFEGQNNEDEIEDAKETAKILGLDHYIKRIDFNDFLKLLKECSKIVEEPLATTSMVPMYFLSNHASNYVKVVLTGQGADEPLGGYNKYKLEILRKVLPQKVTKTLNSMSKYINIKNETISRGLKCISIKDEIDRFISNYEIFTEDEIKSLVSDKDSLSKKTISDMYFNLGLKKINEPVEKMMALDTRMNLSDDLLNYTDKITMNFSLECRVPFLDIRLIEFIESLNYKSKLNIKESKIIHKKFAKNILPLEIIKRKKKGFQSPTRKWFFDEIETIKDILLQKQSKFSKKFNLNFVEEILLLHTRGFNKEKQIFLLLSIFFWLEENED